MDNLLIGPYRAEQNPPRLFLPLNGVAVPAGFPSPAEDWSEDLVDLNLHYVTNPETTFYFTVAGDSMISAMAERAIPSGATLIVDRSREAQHDDIVVAMIDGDFTVKRLFQRGSHLALVADNPAYLPIVLSSEQELSVWGVVTAWIMKL
jgi:DNA polymerase V